MMRKISQETMIFMRGKYLFDEIRNGINELAFYNKNDLILKIGINYDNFKFYINDQCIHVNDIETLNTVKGIIHSKVEFNRKPFSKENAIYADCGHRCDLCVHYKGAVFTDEFRIEIGNRIERAYDLKGKDCKLIDSIHELYKRRTPCDGCHKGGIDGKFNCYQRNCAKENETEKCINCKKYPCDKACVGLPPEIHTRTIYAEDVTWGILPFVYKQYGN